MMDRLNSMAVFVKAVDAGSFAAAAAILDMSAPMVGKHVRALEDRLGARLLDRTTRRQSLTELGRVYYERCRVLLKDADEADALIVERHARPFGRLRVTMPVHFGRRCASPVLLRLAADNPELELELSFNDRFVDLVADEFDLAIRTGEPGERGGVMTRRLASQQMIVCTSPAYIERFGTPRSIGDLKTCEALIYRRSGRVRPWLFPADGSRPLEILPRHRLRFDDLDAIADAAAAGAGVAWLPSWLVAKQLSTGDLVQIFPRAPSFPYDVFALWLETRHMPAKLRLAIDALAAQLPRMMLPASARAE